MKLFATSILMYFIGFLHTFANDAGVLGNFQGTNAESAETLRKGEVDMNDIPVMIRNIIDFGLGIAGTISVIFIIIGAYHMLFGSLTQDTTKGKNTIIMAISGFVIASLAWFIIRFILDNLASI